MVVESTPARTEGAFHDTAALTSELLVDVFHGCTAHGDLKFTLLFDVVQVSIDHLLEDALLFSGVEEPDIRPGGLFSRFNFLIGPLDEADLE